MAAIVGGQDGCIYQASRRPTIGRAMAANGQA